MIHLAAALLALLTTPDAPADPKAVYLRVRDAVSALPVPQYIAFTFQDATHEHSEFGQERARIVVRTSDGHGFLQMIRNADGTVAHSDPAIVGDDGRFPVGIYRVGDFPLADFGLRKGTPNRPGIFEARSSPEPQPSDNLKSIGSITIVGLPYRIVDLGDTTVADVPVYHLGLTPLRDAGHHVLRELWIDKATYFPVRCVAERFVDDGLLTFRYLVTVNMAVIGGHLVATDATGHFSIHRALVLNITGDAHWSISDVSFPTEVPDWLFDPASFKQHAFEPLPPAAEIPASETGAPRP